MYRKEREGRRRGREIGSETKHLNRLGCKIKSNSEQTPLWGAKVLLRSGLRPPWVPGQKSWGTDVLGEERGEERGKGKERRGGAGVFFILQLKSTGRLCYITSLCVEGGRRLCKRERRV